MNKHTKFFFIIGRPRTGTTLFRMMFDAHSNVQIPIEGPFMIALYKRFHNIKFWDKELLTEFHDSLYNIKHFNEWTIDRDQLKKDILTMTGEHSYQELIILVNSHYNSIFPKDEILIHGDKNPYYTLHTDKLLKLFPEARFLFIVRDYRDHFQSMMHRDFEADIPALLGWRWKYYIKSAQKFIKHHPDKSMLIQYENFVNEPIENIKKASAFLGIPFQENVMNFYKSKDNAMFFHGDEMKKNHMSLSKPINKGRIGVWKKDLNEKQVKALECSVGKWGDSFGYKKEHPFSLKCYLSILPTVIYGKCMYAAINLGYYLPWKTQKAMIKHLSFFLSYYQTHLKGKK